MLMSNHFVVISADSRNGYSSLVAALRSAAKVEWAADSDPLSIDAMRRGSR